MVQSIIACPKTLIELVLDPDCNRDYEEFDDRIDALNQLKSLIHSYRVNLYILPSALMVIHTYLRRSANEAFANRAIAELLALGNVTFSLDYEHNIESALALIQTLSSHDSHDQALSMPLHEALIVPAATELNVSALVITEPRLLSHLVEVCSSYPGFDIPILSIREAITYLMESEQHIFVSDSDILARTPKGTIKKLRKGSTVIDFAYAIHTDIGSKCIGALVNHENATLDRVIAMNDMVEILLGDDIQTQEAWLQFAKTRTARKAIKKSIRKTFQDQGWELVKAEFNLRTVRPQLDAIAKKMNMTTNRLMERIGRGLLPIVDLANALQQVIIDQIDHPSATGQNNGYFVIGQDHSRWKQTLSSCCMPFPGDEVVGIVGMNDDVIRIHCRACENITKVQPAKLINVQWGCSYCSVEVYLVMKDSPDTLRKILNDLADQNGLITDLRSVQISKDLARSTLTLPIGTRTDLDQIVKLLQAMPNVSQVKVKKTYPAFNIPAFNIIEI